MTAENIHEAPVLAERRGPVLLLTLNRPATLNAWNRAMDDLYLDLLAEADDDPAVRAVVVTGAGRGFSSGADLAWLAGAGETTADDLAARRPADTPRYLRKPLIAAVNGVVAGMSLAQVLHCDVRFGSPAARFTTAFARRGLIAEYGTTVLLARALGRSRAADLLLSGRMVEADEALRIGLLDRIADDVVEAAVAYAADLAAHCSPRSMAVIKDQLRSDADDGLVPATVRAEAAMLEAFRTPDADEGVASFREKRPPQFPPLPPRTGTAADDAADARAASRPGALPGTQPGTEPGT